MRVLGGGFSGSGNVLVAGLRWAVTQGYDVINMSLSTTKRQLGEALHELADSAYFNRTSSSRRRTTCRWSRSRGASRR